MLLPMFNDAIRNELEKTWITIDCEYPKEFESTSSV